MRTLVQVLGLGWMLAIFGAGIGRAAPAAGSSRYCADADCAATRQYFKNLCDFILKEKSHYPTLYIGGYYMRSLVAGYQILGDKRYLDAAIGYGDFLLGKQMTNGFWPTGYGPVYLADTGVTLGLFAALYEHVDAKRKARYLDAVEHYANSIIQQGMIDSSGAFGTGWKKVQKGKLEDPVRDPYTLSSALTGGEIFTWLYHVTKEEKYRDIAYRAIRWVLGTMDGEGNIPYILAMDGAVLGNPKAHNQVWHEMTFGTAGYVGEGIIAFDLYCDQPAWKAWVEKAVRPNIEFLLRHQLPDGTWSKLGPHSWDRTRSPGVINYLIWYDQRVRHDRRIMRAVRQFDGFLSDPNRRKAYGLLGPDIALKGHGNEVNDNTVTSLTVWALAAILSAQGSVAW